MVRIKTKTNAYSNMFANTCASITSKTISVFLLILVMIFPLILHESYVDILKTKYQCYYMTILGMLTILLLLAVIMLFIDLKEYHGKHTVYLLEKLHPKNWKSTFYSADFVVMIFWLILLTSTLKSKYLYESFWGNEGRYSGFFLFTLYVISYVIISHFWKVNGLILEVFLFSSLIICCIGITDYFQMDILHFRGKIKPAQSTIFTSTLGNINTYTAYVALMLGIASAMFTTSKKTAHIFWYYFCMTIGFFAIIMGCSDNAYLALGVLFGFLPFILFKSRTGILRYFLMLATFGSVIQCIDFINQAYSEVVIGLDSLFLVLTNFNGLIYIVITLWLICLIIMIIDKKHPPSTDQTGNILIQLWGILMIICTLIVCFLMYDANIANHTERYEKLGKYLIFNDNWGTNRGYIWRKSIEIFRGFPLMRKLFGYGLDTFGILTTKYFYADMIHSAQGQIFDNAHNEYLQYLITTGALGLFSYILFLAVSMWKMAQKRSQNKYIAGCLFAVLSYHAQAFVNINLPIATPIMWLLLSIGMAACREKNSKSPSE